MRASGHTAVMACRTEAPDSLDYFPTPPWATRAFLPILETVDPNFRDAVVWEPACGEGHMATVLAESARRVFPSDIFDYGCEQAHLRDFLSTEASPLAFEVGSHLQIDWIITNPPFKTAASFAELGLQRARRGVALLVRTAWLEGGDRHARLFGRRQPRLIAQYAERVPMTKGRWDPDASTATAYCWVVWTAGHGGPTEFCWIAPGQRRALSRPEDVARFAVRTPTALFSNDEAAA